MIQQQQNQQFSFIPILQSCNTTEDGIPTYSQYSYDFYNKLLKTHPLVVNMDQVPPIPYYSAVVQISNTSNYLITGGVYYAQDNTEQIYSTNGCFSLSIKEDQAIFQSFDTQTQGYIIPSMLFSRHNHKVFELVENNNKVFIAVGGQYLLSNETGILQECEKIVEGSNEWIEIAPLSKNRTGFSGFVLNNKIYIFGGIEYIDEEKPTLIPITIVEIYNIELNIWEIIKYKSPLGITISRDSLCLPIEDSMVLVFGGAKDRSSDQILIMDVSNNSYTKHRSKLSFPHAKAYGKFIKGVQTKQILRTQDSERIEENSKDLIVIYGGSHRQLMFEIYETNINNLDIVLLAQQDISNILDDSYEINPLSNQSSWVFAFSSLPILTLQQ